MKLNFVNLPKDYFNGVKELQSVLKFEEAADGIPVTFKAGEGLQVEMHDGKAEITVERKHWFFRSLGLLCENLAEGKQEFEISEATGVEKTGLMIDASRNAVMTVDAIKEMTRYLAVMGYGLVMMYTEDTYEVKEYPYFGYMRGRYTYDELKSCDDYADMFGIEMIPCIQALSHLEQFLRWNEVSYLKDTKSILLVGSEKTYEFLDACIKSAMAPFRSKRINLGMDEAWELGRGRYLDKNGLRPTFEIFCDHLKRIDEITKKYGAEPIIWTSTFRSVCEVDGKFDPKIAEKVKALLPDGISLNFAHYGEVKNHLEENAPNVMLFGAPISYGGGLWNWAGHYPEWNWSFYNIKRSVDEFNKYNMSEYIMTSWGNDGHECDPFAILPGLLYTSELCFNAPGDTDTLRRRFNFLFSGDYDAFYDMHNYQNNFDDDSVYEKNFHLRFCGKKNMWNDPMEGLIDHDLMKKPMSDYYKRWADRYEPLKNDTSRWGYLYGQAYNVFNVLAQKCYISEQLVTAYKNNDREFLKRVADELFPSLKKAVAELQEVDRSAWLSNRKVFGWSLQDWRYGGLISRIDTGIIRLNQYLKGEIDRLEDLEEPRMHVIGGGGFPSFAQYAVAMKLWN